MGKYFLKYPNRNISLARTLRRQMTDAERKLWSHIRRKQSGVKFRRQVAFGNYILDFFCHEAKLAVELDGSQHYTIECQRKDHRRDNYLRRQGLTIIRFSNHEVLTNIDGVLAAIWMHVNPKADPL